MENSSDYFSPDEINSIFSFFTVLHNSILWIMDENYQKLLFISPGFEEKTGIAIDSIKEKWTGIFAKMPQIHSSNKPEKIIVKLMLRQIPNQSVAYCLSGKEGGNLYIKDTFLSTIKHKATDQVLKIGVIEYITLREYEEYLSRGKENNISFFEIFEKVNEENIQKTNQSQRASSRFVSVARINDENIKITRREGECLAHLLKGLSSKHIAKNLNISPRTVEIHLENVKRKTNTLSRIELVSKLQNSNDFNSYLN